MHPRNPSDTRSLAIGRIHRSVEQSRTDEQLASTERLLEFYYCAFPFDPRYFGDEWEMDYHLQTQRARLRPEGEPVSSPSSVTRPGGGRSVVRLGKFVDSLTVSELDQQWPDLPRAARDVTAQLPLAVRNKIQCLARAQRAPITHVYAFSLPGLYRRVFS